MESAGVSDLKRRLECDSKVILRYQADGVARKRRGGTSVGTKVCGFGVLNLSYDPLKD